MFLIALFIMAIAWINYINLATARSMERAKEVGIRKVLGAKRSGLIAQFLSESLLLNFASLLIAFMAVLLLTPWFNQFTGHNASGKLFNMSAYHWLSDLNKRVKVSLSVEIKLVIWHPRSANFHYSFMICMCSSDRVFCRRRHNFLKVYLRSHHKLTGKS